MSCGWLPFWGSPAGSSFPNGRPSGKRSSSSCVLMVVGASSGCGGWAPSSRPSGFRKWVPSPSGPFPAVLCPSIGRPGGAGVRRLGCRGAAAGLLSALPRHSSCSIVPIPMPFSSPISIPGAVLEYFSLVLVSKAALELAPLPSPGFYSLLFVVL